MRCWSIRCEGAPGKEQVYSADALPVKQVEQEGDRECLLKAHGEVDKLRVLLSSHMEAAPEDIKEDLESRLAAQGGQASQVRVHPSVETEHQESKSVEDVRAAQAQARSTLTLDQRVTPRPNQRQSHCPTTMTLTPAASQFTEILQRPRCDP